MRRFKLFFVLFLSLFFTFALASCGDDNTVPSDGNKQDVIVTKYKVTWKNANGDVLEEDSVEKGKIPTYKGATPTLVVPGQTNTFIGWDKVATEVTADTTYTAVYSTEKSKYTVFWKNYNGDVLETDSNVEYGTIPTYDHNDPTRPNEGKFASG